MLPLIRCDQSPNSRTRSLASVKSLSTVPSDEKGAPTRTRMCLFDGLNIHALGGKRS